MERREFLALGSLAIAGLATGAAGQTQKQFVCPPCGCPDDGKLFSEPGRCPACSMGLVEKSTVDQLTGIPNFLRIDNQVWTGGQPTMDHLSKLKEEGVKVVINLRPHSESNSLGDVEATRLQELDLKYFNVPVVFGDLRDSSVDEFLRITDQQLKDGPVFIHCAAGIRVGGFWMIRRVLRDGWDFDKALQEAKQIGLGDQSPLIEFARSYIQKHKN